MELVVISWSFEPEAVQLMRRDEVIQFRLSRGERELLDLVHHATRLDSRRRKHLIAARVNSEELRALDTLVSANGADNRSDWIRKAIAAGIDQMRAGQGEEMAATSNLGGELLRAFEGGG
jgi:hypothetical protein